MGLLVTTPEMDIGLFHPWVGLGWTGSKIEAVEKVRWGLRTGLL